MTRRNVAAAAVVDEDPGEATQCADTACAAALTQTPTGRRRVYCDATCRANAHRRRLWDEYTVAYADWLDRGRDEEEARHRGACDRWEALPWTPEPAWAVEARAAGWHPPSGYRRTKAERRPVLVLPTRPTPPAVSRPREHARSAW